ncbi:hypothetical protein E4U11_006926 [Claviceps purpurea]|nr:hypothetical protein E4U11_006926 [Claviceps purpurea]
MSTYTIPTNEKLASLCDEEDWRPWFNMIKGRASLLEIWDELNPDHPSTFMKKPTDDRMWRGYPVRGMRTVAKAYPQRPQPKDYEAKAGIEEPTHMSHLSKNGLKAFKEDKQDYKDNVDDWMIQYQRYKEERQKVYQLTSLIQSTVALHLQESSCLAGLTLTDWISNLKNSVGADDDTERERVRAWYRTTQQSIQEHPSPKIL